MAGGSCRHFTLFPSASALSALLVQGCFHCGGRRRGAGRPYHITQQKVVCSPPRINKQRYPQNIRTTPRTINWMHPEGLWKRVCTKSIEKFSLLVHCYFTGMITVETTCMGIMLIVSSLFVVVCASSRPRPSTAALF